MQGYLTNANFSIKVAKIDAAAAITELKQQIRAEVMGLSAGAGVGNSEATLAPPQVAAAQKELNILMRNADGIYRRVSSMGGGQADDIVRQYRELSVEIQKARTLEGQALTEATAGIQKKVAALRTQMEAISSIDKVEQQRVGTLKQISQLEGKLDNNLARTLPGQSQPVGNALSGLKMDARMASTGEELAGIRNRYTEVAAAAKAAGLEAQSFGSNLQNQASKLSVWAVATSMIMGAVKAVKLMIENVKQLDMELIELKKVTDLSAARYAELMDEAAVIARSVGATLSDTIRAEADFARLGYDTNGQAQELAQAALVYKHVGDGIRDISEASESIISTMKAFGIEAENSMRIVDAFNEIGNRFAISSAGVGEAMKRSSAALAAANNTFEESIALTVGMNNVIQNPEKVGTTLKTVTMFLRAAKVELEEAGESAEGMASSTSKLRESILALTRQKVDIQLDENTFKSTYQIMKEISEVWSDMADIDQAALLELIGGKRNATAVVSLITNFADAERALEVAANSAGSALEENEKWLAGIEGRMSQFAAAFEDLSRKIIDSELFKGLIDTGTFFIDVLIKITDGVDKLTGGLGGIPVAVAAITAAMGIMSKDGVKGGPFDFQPGDLTKAAESVKAFGANIQSSIKDVGLFKTGVGEAKSAMEGIKGVAQNAGASMKSFWTGFSNGPKDIKALLGYAKELNTINEAQAKGLIDIKQNNELAAQAYQTHIASVDGLKASTISTANAMKTGAVSAKQFAAGAGAIGVGSKAAAIGLKALSIAANMLFNMAIAAVITAIIKGIDNFINRAEIAAEKAREVAQAANDAANDSVDKYQSLVSLVDEYQKISASGTINTADIEKARDLQDQIVKIVGRQVDGLDLVNGASQAQVEILKEQLRLRAEDARIAATAAYSASVGATEKVQLQEKGFLGLYKGAYSSKHWASKDEQAARKALQDANLWKASYDTIRTLLIDELWPSPDFVITLDWDMDGNKLDTIYKKINYLRELIVALEKDENIDIASNKMYLGLVQQMQALEATAAPNIEASVRMLDSVMTTTELASGETMKAVQDLEQYKKLRGDLIKDISGNASLAGPLESGAIAMSRVESAVDAMLARNIPEWFDAAREAATDINPAFINTAAVIEQLGDSIDSISKRQKLLQTAMSEMGNPAGNGGISADTIKSIQDALSANEKLTDYIEVQNGVIKLNTEAWNNRTFGDIKSQIAALQDSTRELEKQNAQLIAQNDSASWLELLTGKYSANSKKIEENTAAIEANQEALGLYQAIYDQIMFVDIWDFANMANDLNSVQSAASGLISAMQQLKDGTALTKAELAKLAIQYPELLSAAKLFEDGSIAGQKRMLDAALQAYEAQYDAEIDKDIAILEATNQLLQDQIDLEDAKSAILSEISQQEVTGQIADRVWLQEKLSELNDLEGQNHVTMEEGKLKVNQEALEGLLRQTGSYGTQADSIWSRISAKITNRFTDLIQKAKKLALTIMYALVGKVYDPGSLTDGGGGLTFSDSDYKINDQGISDWLSEQETILAARRKAMRDEIEKNLAAIENLKKLKGLDLTSIYGSSGSGGKGSGKDKKDIEDYTAKIDELYEAELRLAEAQRARADIEAQIAREEDPAKRIGLRKQLIDAYNEEIDAAENLLQARQGLVGKSVEELKRLGFEVEYNNETNRLYIANKERINELTAESKGKYGSLQEATNEYRKSVEQLIADVETWNKTNQDAVVGIDAIRDGMRKAKNEILSDIESVRKAAEDALKSVVAAYQTLKKASTLNQLQSGNYLEAFFPSVSTFESLMAMESKYLNYLSTGAGMITMNEAALRRLTAARVEELAVTQAMALVDTIELHRGDTKALQEMAGMTMQATDATWDLVYAKLAQQNLDKDLNDAFLKQIDTMRKLSKRTQIGVALGVDMGSTSGAAGGIAQAIVGAVGNGLLFVMGDVAQSVSSIAERAVRATAGATQEVIQSAVGSVAQSVTGAVTQALGGAVDGAVQMISGAAGRLMNFIGSASGDAIESFTSSIGEAAKALTSTLTGLAEGTIGAAVQTVTGIAGSVVNSVASAAGSAMEYLASAAGSAAQALANAAVNAAKSIASGISKAISDIAGTGILNLGNAIGTAIQSLGGIANSVMRSFTDAVTRAAQSLSGLFSGFAQNVITGVMQVLDGDFSGLILTISGSIGNALKYAANAVGNAFQSMTNLINDIAQNITSGIMRVVTGVVESYIQAFSSAISSIMQSLSNIAGNIMSAIVGAAGNAAKTIAGALGDMASNILGGIMSSVSAIAGSIGSAFAGATGDILSFAMGAIGSVIQSVLQKAKDLLRDFLKELKAFVDEFIRTMKQTYKDMLSNQKGGLDEVLKLTMDLIKYEVEMKIKGLREQIEAYKEIVDLKKKELDLTRQQAKYEEGLADRVADVARLQAEIAQLALDDSREAAALRAAKEKELADKQRELANYQDDHAYDSQIRALDDAADAYAKAKQAEIEELEKTISSAEKIYQMAVKRLEEDFWGLYQQVIDWNTEAGSSLNKEVTEAWKEAAKAVVLYGSYLNAVKAVEIQLKIQAEGIGAVIVDLLMDVAGGFFVRLYDMFATFLNKFLKYIGVQLPTSENTGTTGGPVTPGGAFLGIVGDVIGGAINGIVNGVKNFVGGIFSKFPFFHTGGHVGKKVGKSSGSPEEVIAVLHTDEVVLTKQHQKNLLSQMDFLRELGANVDTPISLNAGYAGVLNRLMAGPRSVDNYGDVNHQGNITVSAPIEVIIQHCGAMDNATAVRFGKKVSETAVGSICEAFRKKGIRPGAGNSALKP